MPTPRKSLEQHIKDGTYRRDRHGPRPEEIARTPVSERVVPANPERPEDLTGVAGEVWDKLIGLLGEAVHDRDRPLLAELCRWWAELKRVQTALAESAPGEKGYNQLLIAGGICSDKLDKLASRFGLTPADRAKLKAENTGPPIAKVPTRPRTKLDQQGPPKV